MNTRSFLMMILSVGAIHAAETPTISFFVGKEQVHRSVCLADFEKLMQRSQLLKIMPHDDSPFPLALVTPTSFDTILTINRMNSNDEIIQQLKDRPLDELVDLVNAVNYLDNPRLLKKTLAGIVVALHTDAGIKQFVQRSDSLSALSEDVRRQLAESIGYYLPCLEHKCGFSNSRWSDYGHGARFSPAGDILALSTESSVLLSTPDNIRIKEVGIPCARCMAFSIDGSRCAIADRNNKISIVNTYEPNSSFVTLAGTFGGIKQLSFDQKGEEVIVRTPKKIEHYSIPDKRCTKRITASDGWDIHDMSDHAETWAIKKKGSGIAFLSDNGKKKVEYPEYDSCELLNISGTRAIVSSLVGHQAYLYLVNTQKNKARPLALPTHKKIDTVFCGSFFNNDTCIALNVHLVGRSYTYRNVVIIWNPDGRMRYRIDIPNFSLPSDLFLKHNQLFFSYYDPSIWHYSLNTYACRTIDLPDFSSLTPEQMIAVSLLIHDKQTINHQRIRQLYARLPDAIKAQIDLSLLQKLQAKIHNLHD